jgi:PAS domain S-box-containing protein
MPEREARRLFAALAVVVALMAAVVALSYGAFRRLADANRWAVHTHRVLEETAGMEAALGRMETAFRGFALTGDPAALSAWGEGRARFGLHAARVRALTADNPAQQRRVDELARLHRAWVGAQLATGIADPALRERARAAAADPAGVAARAARAEAMRALVAGVEAAETALLRERTARARAWERRAEGLILGGGVAAIVLALVGSVVVYRSTRRLRDALRARAAEGERSRLASLAADRLGRQNALLLEAAAEGIYGIDAHGYTTFLNPAAASLLGHPAEELIGRPYEATLLSHSAGADPVRAALLSGSACTVADATFRKADGTRFPVEYTCTPIVEEGRIAGAVITFRDVTVRREVDRMKDEFVSVVSHELRTPLTSIRGSLGLLAAGKGGEVSPAGARLLEIAVQNTDRLIRLINDILDLERIEAGKVGLELSRADAAALIRHAAEVMQPMADRAGVAFQAGGASVAVTADGDRILQVLTNLLSNAVKFSPPGSTVEVGVERHGGEALFRVADRGRGIPADRLEAVFERFQQVDSSDSRQKGGTGLGLAIARSLVQQHGGRIWAESVMGEGTTFRFTLPVAGAPDGSEARDPPLPPPRQAAATDVTVRPIGAGIAAGSGAPRVILAEDDEDLAKVLVETFRRRGIEAAHARTGEEAVQAALAAAPALLVLDPGLPAGDGFAVVERLRASGALAALPVIVYSARDLDEGERARLRLGPTEFLTKGRAAPDELERRALALLARGGDGDESAPPGPGVSPGPP